MLACSCDDLQDSVLSKADVCDELLYDMVSQLQLRPVMALQLPTVEHAGMQEMAALAAVIRMMAEDPRTWRSRVIVLVD
jgi:hypothetical protein